MPVHDADIDQSKVISYYEDYDEQSRLTKGAGLLEFLRMREIIGRFASSPPGVVLDVGGRPSTYSLWLASLGYEVHLIDQFLSTWSRPARPRLLSRIIH